MTDDVRIATLKKLGAADRDIPALLEYMANAFQPHADAGTNDLSPKWDEIWILQAESALGDV